ncbi:putative O-glycosylation ligase, exosortase A system-associated [uncultured Paraglaciecola sp.]|uniref:putative O-glycosylation ligase, exosortase A system-associated n=1 Tax=uncultured Paraglaciecola sp. TaxID=1765024 RepID=UPI0026031335|nr:putative O-glycosylation ligase, exosortase A system-associated [uncultured Paraglaciecola sp.]
MRDIALVMLLFVAIYYSFKRPYLGVCAWVWIALTAPANWAYGFSQDFRLNLTIVIVTFFSYLFVTKNKHFNISGLGGWILFFGFWTFLSSVLHVRSIPDDVWFRFTEFMKVLMLFMFAVLILRTRLHIETFIWAIVLSISSYAGMEAVKFILSGGGHRIVGVAGQIADRNDLAVAINMCIPLIVYLMQTCKDKRLKVGLWALLALNIISIVGTFSRGGFIGLAILSFAFWWKSKHKFALAILAAVMLPLMYAVAPADWKERQNTVSTAATEDGSFIGRLWAWKISTLIAIDNPVTGGGFKAVTDPLLWHRYRAKTPDFTFLETPTIPPTLLPKAAHNIYMQVLGDHGFVGLGIFLVILLKTLRMNNRNRKLAIANNSKWCDQLCLAITLSLVGFCITGANVSRAYFDLLYAIIAIVVVINSNNLSSNLKSHE